MPQITLDMERAARLDNAATCLGGSRQDILNQAVDMFLDSIAERADYEAWFRRKVEKSIKAADEGKLVPASEVDARSEAKITKLLSARGN